MADFIRQRAQQEAARIDALHLNPFSQRAEIRRSALRVLVPYSLLEAEVTIRRYERSRLPEEEDCGI
jgi:hypothetical protein